MLEILPASTFMVEDGGNKFFQNVGAHYKLQTLSQIKLSHNAHGTGVNICRDCATYFGQESLQPITRDDSVVCETQYSKVVPLEGGEVCMDKED